MDGGTPFGRASRTVDLSNFDTITLTILGRCQDDSSGFESNDFVRVDVSTDGGVSYTSLWNRTGSQICPDDDDEQNQNISVTLPAGNSNTIIRLRSDLNSSTEDYYWDNVLIRGVSTNVANNDTASTTAGVANNNVINAISNDTFNGNQATTANTDVNLVSRTNTNININTDGIVSATSNLPVGTHSLAYL
jgi:hypothetical protein